VNLELIDKTALISGSSKGIGFAIASQLATEGARVMKFAKKIGTETRRFDDKGGLSTSAKAQSSLFSFSKKALPHLPFSVICKSTERGLCLIKTRREASSEPGLPVDCCSVSG
jgi:hypothetical protein